MNARLRRLYFVAFTVCGFFFLTGCDSGDPVDEPDPADVAGTYTAARLVFDPDAAALADVNVVQKLTPNTLRLRLFGDGQYTLEYQFLNGPLSVASGTFSVSANRITIVSDRSDRERHANLLLNSETRFERSTGTSTTLTAAVEKSVNLEDFDAAFTGLTDVPGVLNVQFVLQR